jgi:hypothetical protein
MALLRRKNPSSGHIPVYAGDGIELGIVFLHEDRDCVNPGWHWYAISQATGSQVGPAFDSQAQAEAALRDS